MRNYCYKVSKNGWRSHDKIDTITGIHVYELNKTKTEKRIEDLRKAVFYIQDEIKLLEHGTD